MSRARVLADLLDSTGDVKLANLDNTTSVTVTDTLTSTSTSEALSANQGKTLKTLADSKEAADATILKDAAIGVNVQAYDSTIVVDADIGSTVQAYDSTILKNADIGSTVQAYDNVLATVASSGIGTSANQMVRLDGSAKLPAVDGSALTGLGGGLSEADLWVLTTSQDGEAFLTANLSRYSYGGFGKLGTGMSQSSGVFTFPSTGYWLINALAHAYAAYGGINIHTTTNNSTWYTVIEGKGGGGGSGNVAMAKASFIMDVTNTSTHKIKFAGRKIYGSATELKTSFQFIKMGET